MAQSDSVQDPKERALNQDVASFGHLCTLGVSDTCLSAVDRVTCVQSVRGSRLQFLSTGDKHLIFSHCLESAAVVGCLSPFPHLP